MTALALAVALAAAGPTPIPPLTGPVVDRAGVLDARGRAALEELSRAARAQERGQGVQLQYLIVPSLQGEPIEDFSIRVAEAWKIGTRGRDNGMLVVVSMEERAARIEVGGGLEGSLTDAQAGRIIRDSLIPQFRAGRYSEGLLLVGQQMLGSVGALPRGVLGRPARPAPGQSMQSVALLGFFLLFFFFRIFSGFGRRRRRALWWFPVFIPGGGGRGGGGGGWGGGGGGFSGGGASGRW